VQVRSDFRSTILWLPDVKTDADGTATVKVKYPDSLTTWSATARVVTAGNQFGIGNSTTRTKQPLIVRLQAPRFFVVGDQVSQLPGWQEGAMMSAQHVVEQIGGRRLLTVPRIKHAPNTRRLIHGRG